MYTQPYIYTYIYPIILQPHSLLFRQLEALGFIGLQIRVFGDWGWRLLFWKAYLPCGGLGLGFRVWGLGFRVQGSGLAFRVYLEDPGAQIIGYQVPNTIRIIVFGS